MDDDFRLYPRSSLGMFPVGWKKIKRLQDNTAAVPCIYCHVGIFYFIRQLWVRYVSDGFDLLSRS